MKKDTEQTPKYEGITHWQLMKRKFLKNRLAVISGIILLLIYLIIVFFPKFFSTYDYNETSSKYLYAPPQLPRFIDNEGDFHLRPFIYAIEGRLNPETFQWEYSIDYSQK